MQIRVEIISILKRDCNNKNYDLKMFRNPQRKLILTSRIVLKEVYNLRAGKFWRDQIKKYKKVQITYIANYFDMLYKYFAPSALPLWCTLRTATLFYPRYCHSVVLSGLPLFFTLSIASLVSSRDCHCCTLRIASLFTLGIASLL